MKSRNGLTIIKKIEVNFTAEQWGLFTSSMDCADAAQRLNANLQQRVNEGRTRGEVNKLMGELMDYLSDFGAADSEPYYFLQGVLEDIYGRTDDCQNRLW